MVVCLNVSTGVNSKGSSKIRIPQQEQPVSTCGSVCEAVTSSDHDAKHGGTLFGL